MDWHQRFNDSATFWHNGNLLFEHKLIGYVLITPTDALYAYQEK
jgi:hypothetical protein